MKSTALAWTCLAILACASAPETKPSSSEKFQAKLDSASEVPSPSLSGTSPSGTATFTPQGDTLIYKVAVIGLSSPYVAAHIHTGAPGVAGAVIVPLALTSGPGEGAASGEGTIDAAVEVHDPGGSVGTKATTGANMPARLSNTSSTAMLPFRQYRHTPIDTKAPIRNPCTGV